MGRRCGSEPRGSNFSILGPPRPCSAQMRSPRRREILDLAQYFEAEDAHEAEDGDADEQHGDVERLAGEIDEITETRRRAEPFGDGDAGETAAERQTEPGEDER